MSVMAITINYLGWVLSHRHKLPLLKLDKQISGPIYWSFLAMTVSRIDPNGKLVCSTHTKTIMQHIGNIPIMFDDWANPVVHLLLLKGSTSD